MRLVIIAILLPLLSTGVRAQEPTEKSPRLLVHLLDYVAQDYGGAVSNGKILSQSEYQEQTEFTASALEMAKTLPETKGNAEVSGKIAELQTVIAARGAAVQVARLAQEAKHRVIELTSLQVAPTRWPNLAHGKQVFAQNCVACHGAEGRGNGPAAAGLKPQPANFHDDARMNALSPFKAFNAIRVGVPGTAMVPLHQLSDKEAWDVAFYVLSIRHENEKAQARESERVQPVQNQELERVATESDSKLEHSRVAALRLHSGKDENANTLAIARTYLVDSMDDYRAGKSDSAKHKALLAYLEGVEPVEPRLKANDPEFTSTLETKMGLVRSAIEGKKPASEVQAAILAANQTMDEADKMLTSAEPSPWLTFLITVGILLREGFEAVLILVALLAVIRASGSRRAAAYVHAGWISALGVGGLLWVFSGWLMGISGAQRELMEAVTALLAVAVLLYMGFWLHSKTEIGRWRMFIHGQVKQALEGSNLYGLTFIAFMAVFREAFETVLFLRAVLVEGGDDAAVSNALVFGVVGSLALLLVLSWLILKYSARIPIRKVFSVSSVLMAVLAVILTGKGLHSLQETGMLSITASPLNLRWDLFGFYPTRETLLSQLLIFGLVSALWLYGSKPAARPAKSAQA